MLLQAARNGVANDAFVRDANTLRSACPTLL